MTDTTPPTVRATDEARARAVLADAIRGQGDSAQSADGIAAGKDHAVWAKVAIAAMLTFARDASTDAGVREALIAAQDYFASLSAMTADDAQAVFDKINAALATPAPLADAGKPIDAPAIPEGMVAYGPEHPDYPNAPKDWGKGRVWFRVGGGSTKRPGEGLCWRHDPDGITSGRADIIAYTPTPRPAEQPGERERIAAIIARAYGGSLHPGLGVPGDYPTADVDYLAADAILAQPGAGGEVVTISRQRYDRLRFAAGETDSDPELAAMMGPPLGVEASAALIAGQRP